MITDDVAPLHAAPASGPLHQVDAGVLSVGYDLPQEAPRAFADAVLEVGRW